MSLYTYKRGTVIMVDFSPQVGSEIRGKHFAIVLTKRDRNTNELLTVIPLTSKYHPYHLDLDNEIKKSIYLKMYNTQADMVKELNSSAITIDNVTEKLDSVTEATIMINNVLKRYGGLKEHTFAKVHQITTISKFRIVKPVNRYDPIRKLVVSTEVMDRIENKIKELFFKVDIE